MGVNAAQTNQQKKTVRYLVLTIVCACVFLWSSTSSTPTSSTKVFCPAIFYKHGAEDLIKGTHGYATFFAFYFMMTGLHGIHILVGIGLLSWLVMRARRGRFHQRLLHAGGPGGIVLAHRRHDLDLSVPAVLLDHMSNETHTHAEEPSITAVL